MALGGDLDFYPSTIYEFGTDRKQLTWTAQRAVDCCRACLVTVECLESALSDEGSGDGEQRWGIRGGRTPEERAAIYRKRKRRRVA